MPITRSRRSTRGRKRVSARNNAMQEKSTIGEVLALVPCYNNLRSHKWEYSLSSKEQTAMTEQVSPLATFYKPGWENYQHALVHTIATLSSEQLALSPGPHQRSIGELLEHMIGARFNWFYLWMGEGDPNLDWNE